MLKQTFECPFVEPGNECAGCEIAPLPANMWNVAIERTIHTDYNPLYRRLPADRDYSRAANACFDRRKTMELEAALYGTAVPTVQRHLGVSATTSEVFTSEPQFIKQ